MITFLENPKLTHDILKDYKVSAEMIHYSEKIDFSSIRQTRAIENGIWRFQFWAIIQFRDKSSPRTPNQIADRQFASPTREELCGSSIIHRTSYSFKRRTCRTTVATSVGD